MYAGITELFQAFIFLLFVIGGGFLFSKIGSSMIKKDGADVIIWIVWLFIVFGIYLAQTEYITPPPNFIEQILYSLGNYLSCFIGVILATFIGMKGTFTFNNNKKFLHSLNSGIILGFLLLLSTSV